MCNLFCPRTVASIVVICEAGDTDSGQGPAGALLPPAQPALLTMTRDGVMRVWVEVTMATQQQRPADGPAPTDRAPAWGMARGNAVGYSLSQMVVLSKHIMAELNL